IPTGFCALRTGNLVEIVVHRRIRQCQRGFDFPEFFFRALKPVALEAVYSVLEVAQKLAFLGNYKFGVGVEHFIELDEILFSAELVAAQVAAAEGARVVHLFPDLTACKYARSELRAEVTN